MTDSCNQAHERAGDVSSSDDDSVSLLHDPNACQSSGAAEDVGLIGLDSQVGNKEQKRKVEMEINHLKPPEGGMSGCIQSAAGCAEFASQSVTSIANVSKCAKIPNKTRLHRRNEKGETLLHKACKRRDLAQVKVLIQAGISVNAEDYAGWTALHEASAVGDEAVVEELLKARANVNARSFDGVTPLHDAVSSGHHQVVKLLLQYGSNASDRNLGGLSALDMTEEENIRELLSSSQTSAPIHEQPRESPVQCRQPGATSSEAHCHMRLSCQSSFGPSCSDTANVQSRESGDRDGAREPGDIQLRKKDATTDNPRHSEATAVVLGEVTQDQAEISTWPLTGLQDAGRYHAALKQIQRVLIEVLHRQHSEKDNLAQRYQRVPDSLRQRVLKSQLVSLASRQRKLVEILQKQMHLVEVYVTTTARLSGQPPNHQDSTVLRQRPDHFPIPTVSKPRPETWVSPVRSPPPNNTKGLTVSRPAAHFLPRRTKTPTYTQTSRCQSSAPQPGNALQRINFQMKGKNAQIRTQAEGNRGHLSELIQRGAVPPGSAVQLLLKGHWHLAHVQGDGSIKDSKGKLHLAPERWLESILGNNIPVSSAYAWEKVTFRDKSLSYYLLNMEAEGKAPQTHCEDDVDHCRAAASQTMLTTEAAGLNRLMKIKIIHLVDDKELLPNAVMDCYWGKLLKRDCSESEDWGSELL